MPDLARFVAAQEPVYATALGELRAGHKRTHWMWFIFPQLAGLGSSPTAQFYAIASFAEAGEYLAHPLLGPRLADCTAAMLGHRGRTALAILGSPDDMKFRSSMTLFSRVESTSPLFGEALAAFFNGAPDARTLDLLGQPKLRLRS